MSVKLRQNVYCGKLTWYRYPCVIVMGMSFIMEPPPHISATYYTNVIVPGEL